MVYIQNDGAYVKVTHDNGVVIYYVKSLLLIQKHNNEAFSFTCGHVENFYNYSEIVEPMTTTLDELLDLIISWSVVDTSTQTLKNLNVTTIKFI